MVSHYDCLRYGRVRRTDRRREPPVQELPNREIQNLKAAAAWIRAQVDTDWKSSPQWTRGSFRADIYLRSGTEFGAVHHALPKGILPPSWLQSLQLGTQQGRVGKSDGQDQSAHTTIICRGLLGDAGLGESPDFSPVTALSDADLLELGKRLLREVVRRGISRRKSSRRRTKAKANRKRVRVSK